MKKKLSIVPVQPYTDRTIITTYYMDSRRLESARVIRSKHPRLAVMRAADYLTYDVFSTSDGRYPSVAVVFDEAIGKDLAIIVKHKDGKVTYQPLVELKKYELKKFGSFSIYPDRRNATKAVNL